MKYLQSQAQVKIHNSTHRMEDYRGKIQISKVPALLYKAKFPLPALLKILQIFSFCHHISDSFFGLNHFF